MEFLHQIWASAASLCALVGTYCLILSYQKKHEIAHTISKGRSAQGTVSELRESDRGFAPVIEFRSNNGLHKHHSATFRKTTPYQLGQTVTVYYYSYKSRFETALADDQPGSMPATLLKLGIALCAVGYPLVLWRMRGLV